MMQQPPGMMPEQQQAPQQPQGQRVQIIENGQPVAEGVVVGVQVQVDGMEEVTVTPDSQHQIVPVEEQGGMVNGNQL